MLLTSADTKRILIYILVYKFGSERTGFNMTAINFPYIITLIFSTLNEDFFIKIKILPNTNSSFHADELGFDQKLTKLFNLPPPGKYNNCRPCGLDTMFVPLG